MDREDARKAAAAAGLHRLTEPHLDQLAQCLVANTKLMRQLPKDLHWSEEIAPVLRLADAGPRGDAKVAASEGRS